MQKNEDTFFGKKNSMKDISFWTFFFCPFLIFHDEFFFSKKHTFSKIAIQTLMVSFSFFCKKMSYHNFFLHPENVQKKSCPKMDKNPQVLIDILWNFSNFYGKYIQNTKFCQILLKFPEISQRKLSNFSEDAFPKIRKTLETIRKKLLKKL